MYIHICIQCSSSVYICSPMFICTLKFEGGSWDAEEGASSGDTCIYIFIYVKRIDGYNYKHIYVYRLVIHIYICMFNVCDTYRQIYV